MDMKSLFTRIVTVAVVIAATSLSAFSQTRVVEHDLSPFEAIDAENGFKVSIVKSDLYGIKLTVDDALESYVECYVKAGTLHISMDEKSIPKDVKKLYKDRNSGDPTLVAVVYMPTLKSLTLSDNSEFYNSGNLSGDSFNLTMGGSSKTSDLRIVSKNVSLCRKERQTLQCQYHGGRRPYRRCRREVRHIHHLCSREPFIDYRRFFGNQYQRGH